jgi:hypothetical protein
MRLPVQVSSASIVALGHFNPLIFRADWLKDKEIIVGSDFENLNTLIVHPEIVSYQLPWGTFQTDRNLFNITTLREPVVRVHDFFVRCFQCLPETPITAVGINREVQFAAGGDAVADRIGDTLAPKKFWGQFVRDSQGKKIGGLRSIVMEQAVASGGRKMRLDGTPGHIQVKVEPSVRPDISHGIFVSVNDHLDLVKDQGRLADGRTLAELVTERFQASIANSEHLIDHVMELALAT